jgi:hypothetical protein
MGGWSVRFRGHHYAVRCTWRKYGQFSLPHLLKKKKTNISASFRLVALH